MMLMAVPGFPGNQTALNPVGPGASHIEFEFSLIFWITTAVYFIVLLVMVIALARKRHSLDTMPDPQPTRMKGANGGRSVSAAMVVTVVLLFVMLIGSYATGRALGDMNQENALTVDV